MNESLLNAEAREVSSKGKLAALRRAGAIPAVFYGKGIEPKTISVNAKSLISILETKGSNAVITLDINGEKKPSIVKALQRDILSQAPIHIDFHSISLQDTVDVMVPIHIEGVADGVKNFGGLMESILREIEVQCMPTQIPQKIAVDVSSLGIGQGITIAELPQIEGVKYLQEPSTLIVHIVAPVQEEEKPAEAAAGAEAVQPEVITKGKKDKEGEEGAEAAQNPAKK
ncbi:MAG: 50S ribosomal protein L25 [Elusimicrobiota bacterium]|jgi:large subunit ribosomal protein L25|nr:50S ribosomal protein L25 [Elusimicrobiota bacterium]